MGCSTFCMSALDNVLMHVGATGHNAPHYVLYSSMRRQKISRREGSKLNCCKIWALGKHDIIYWSHITGVKVLVIAERGLLLVIMIAADVGGRDTERWKTRATSKSVPAISGRDHHAITQHQLKTRPFSCPFLLHLSAAEVFSPPWM